MLEFIFNKSYCKEIHPGSSFLKGGVIVGIGGVIIGIGAVIVGIGAVIVGIGAVIEA